MDPENFNELKRLCVLHDKATCDYSRCEEFYSRLAKFLDAVEDAGDCKMASMVMDALVNCVPNPSGSCKTADRVKAVMSKLSAFATKRMAA